MRQTLVTISAGSKLVAPVSHGASLSESPSGYIIIDIVGFLTEIVGLVRPEVLVAAWVLIAVMLLVGRSGSVQGVKRRE